VGPFYSSLVSDDLRTNATAKGVSIIEIKTFYGAEDPSTVPNRDMVGVVERFEELALALGAVEPTSVDNDKKALCEAAKAFEEKTQIAHDRGVRVMAAYLPYQEQAQGVAGGFIPFVELDPLLSLLQMLGMPLLYNEHKNSDWENRAGDYLPFSGDFYANDTKSVQEGVPYNVDMWLYDDRITLDFVSPTFAQHWPHPAVTAKQYAYWPSNGRIFSYRHVTEYLSLVGDKLGEVQRVSPASDCTPSSAVYNRNLSIGQYSCRYVQSIDFCNDDGTYSGVDTPSTKFTSLLLTLMGSFMFAVL
jgi:hypothetical protein